MTKRPTFEQAKSMFVHRYTMEYVPGWALQVNPGNGKFYAPQFRTDREWYDNTAFTKAENPLVCRGFCYTSGQTWPLGQWLDKPYRIK